MATMRDIVERAYRKIGVVASDESMTADQAATGLDALNMMMHGWLLDGIDVAHVDMELADTFALQPEFQEGTVYLLANRLAPEFTRPPVEERRFRNRLSAAYSIVPDAVIPTALRNTPSQRRWRR